MLSARHDVLSQPHLFPPKNARVHMILLQYSFGFYVSVQRNSLKAVYHVCTFIRGWSMVLVRFGCVDG